MFIERTDVEAKTLILWPPDAKSWLIWKDPDGWERLRAGGEGDDRGWDAIQPSHPLSFPSPPTLNLSQPSGSFQMSQLFTSGGQSIGVSASASVLPMNIQDWFPLGWTGWISLESKGLSRVFSNTTVQKHQFFGAQLSFTNSHIHTWPLEKP